eukprot:SAG31_NODE_1802_length_7238_cov_3.417285_5_plen_58_part_00
MLPYLDNQVQTIDEGCQKTQPVTSKQCITVLPFTLQLLQSPKDVSNASWPLLASLLL